MLKPGKSQVNQDKLVTLRRTSILAPPNAPHSTSRQNTLKNRSFSLLKTYSDFPFHLDSKPKAFKALINLTTLLRTSSHNNLLGDHKQGKHISASEHLLVISFIWKALALDICTAHALISFRSLLKYLYLYSAFLKFKFFII